MAQCLCRTPDAFNLHPSLAALLQARRCSPVCTHQFLHSCTQAVPGTEVKRRPLHGMMTTESSLCKPSLSLQPKTRCLSHLCPAESDSNLHSTSSTSHTAQHADRQLIELLWPGSKMVETADSRVDFAMAESLAFGTLALHRSFRPPKAQKEGLQGSAPSASSAAEAKPASAKSAADSPQAWPPHGSFAAFWSEHVQDHLTGMLMCALCLLDPQRHAGHCLPVPVLSRSMPVCCSTQFARGPLPRCGHKSWCSHASALTCQRRHRLRSQQSGRIG